MSEPINPAPISSPALLNQWLYDIIEPWLKGRVLEIGSTLESISAIFIQRGTPIHLSTPDKDLRLQLKSACQGVEAVLKVHSLNLRRNDFEQAYPAKQARIFDTVLALNEPCDQTIARNARHLLRARGRLILLTPVYTAMYNGLEQDEEDWKIYNQQAIKRILGDEMEILSTRHHNLVGLSILTMARKKE
jgi:hypothetical protein